MSSRFSCWMKSMKFTVFRLIFFLSLSLFLWLSFVGKFQFRLLLVHSTAIDDIFISWDYCQQVPRTGNGLWIFKYNWIFVFENLLNAVFFASNFHFWSDISSISFCFISFGCRRSHTGSSKMACNRFFLLFSCSPWLECAHPAKNVPSEIQWCKELIESEGMKREEVQERERETEKKPMEISLCQI